MIDPRIFLSIPGPVGPQPLVSGFRPPGPMGGPGLMGMQAPQAMPMMGMGLPFMGGPRGPEAHGPGGDSSNPLSTYSGATAHGEGGDGGGADGSFWSFLGGLRGMFGNSSSSGGGII